MLESQGSPLGIGLIVLVPLVLDHPVAADPHIWPRHLHPIQRNPWRERDEEKETSDIFQMITFFRVKRG